MKPESRQWERKLVRMVSGPYLYSTVNFDFRKFRALTFSSLYWLNFFHIVYIFSILTAWQGKSKVMLWKWVKEKDANALTTPSLPCTRDLRFCNNLSVTNALTTPFCNNPLSEVQTVLKPQVCWKNTTDHRAPAPTFIWGVSSIDPWLTPVKKREIYEPFQINSIPIQRFKVTTWPP